MVKTIQELIGCPSLETIFSLNEKMMSENPLNGMKTENEKEVFHVMKMAPYATILKHGLDFNDIAAFLFEDPLLNEMHFRELEHFIIYFDLLGSFTTETLPKLLRQIEKLRRRLIIKFITDLEKLFLHYHFLFSLIPPHLQLYRVTDREYKNNFIPAFTSWSFYPIEHFCSKLKCHIYILNVSDLEKIKFLYMEIEKPEFTADREFEILLPRGVVFKEIERKNVSAVDKNFHIRRIPRTGKVNFTLHYIRLMKISAPSLNKIKFPEKTKIYYGYAS